MPWDATTSYRAGTANGPAAIFAASKQVDLFDPFSGLESGRPYEAGIAMMDVPEEIAAWNREARALAEPIIEEGGVEVGDPRLAPIDALSKRLNDRVYADSQKWLEQNKIVGVIGGDHSTPFGLMRAMSERHPGFGILHVDAHADLRVAYEGFSDSHASIMYNAMSRLPGVGALVQVGIRDFGEAEHAYATQHPRIVQHHDAVLAHRRDDGATWRMLCDAIVADLPKQVYVSFDIDGLDPAHCPHTGTPVPGGLSFHDACALFRAVVESGRTIVGFDLNEVAPGEDGDEWDANVGARLLYKLIGWTLKSRT